MNYSHFHDLSDGDNCTQSKALRSGLNKIVPRKNILKWESFILCNGRAF